MSDNRPGNWIAMNRDVREHPLVGAGKPVKPDDGSKPAWSRFEAWFDILCLGQFEPTTINNKGSVQQLGAGELMAARGYLAKRWNWHEKTVARWLAALRSAGMLAVRDTADARPETGQQYGQRRSNKCTVLTICNWSLYQRSTANRETGERAAPRTPLVHRAVGERAQLNKENNSTLEESMCGSTAHTAERGPREIAEEQFEIFWQAFPAERRRAKGDACDLFCKIVLGQHRKRRATAEQIIDAVRAGLGIDPKFPPMPTTWLNGGRWGDAAPCKTGQTERLSLDEQQRHTAALLTADGPWDERQYGPNPHRADCWFSDCECRRQLQAAFDDRGMRKPPALPMKLRQMAPMNGNHTDDDEGRVLN